MKGKLGAFRQDTLYLGDALALLPKVPGGSVDLIVTDPPFAIDFRAQRLNYNRKGSNVIEGYREIPEEEYGEFTRTWMAEASRVLAPAGSMYVFSGWNRIRDILEGIDSSGLTTINHLIWKYQFGVFTKKKYVTSHYHVLFVAKDPKRYTFNKIDHYPEDVWTINREYWKGRKKTPTKLPRNWSGRSCSIRATPGTSSSTRSSDRGRWRLWHSRKAGISSGSRSCRSIVRSPTSA